MQNMTLKKRLPLSSDIVFKRAFSKEENKPIAHMKFEPNTKETYVDMGYSKEDELATDRLEMITIELKKFKKRNPDSKSILNQWLWLILGKEEKIKMASEEIKKAINVIDEMSMDPKEWERYRSRQMAIMNYNIGMANARKEGEEIGEKRGQKIGEQIGEKKAKIETAKKLLAMGMTIEQVIEATGLTKEEIEDIKMKCNK